MFPEHSVSEDGTTITNKSGRIIKQGQQIIKGKATGYLYASMLSHDYAYKQRVGVHRLVAFAWLPDPPTAKHVWINHKDGNKANNHANNLEWSTISQNIQHAFDTGLHKVVKGADHWQYGKTASNETKRLQSLAKRGTEAGNYLKVASRTISRRIKSEKWRLKGFYLVPKQ